MTRLLLGLAALSAGLFLGSACQSTGVAEMPVVGIGDECGLPSGTQCDPGLTCLNRICYQVCDSDDDCAAFDAAPACLTVEAFASIGKVCGEPRGSGGAGGTGGAGGEGGGAP